MRESWFAKYFVILPLFLTSAVAQDSCAIAGSQCGNAFGKCCGVCTVMNERYSECRSLTSTPESNVIVQSDTTPPPVYGSGCVNARYKQCGGKSWTGATCCPDDMPCVYVSEYYSQCRPNGPAPPTAPGSPAYGGLTCSAKGAQCGGKLWTGATCCVAGLDCIKSSEIYSQCQTRKSSHTISAPHNTKGCGARWARCGAPGHPGCCLGYNKCVKQNEYYSQCLPTELPNGVVGWWQHCGGEGWKGNTKCEPQSSCVALNKWVSLCTPSQVVGG